MLSNKAVEASRWMWLSSSEHSIGQMSTPGKLLILGYLSKDVIPWAHSK